MSSAEDALTDFLHALVEAMERAADNAELRLVNEAKGTTANRSGLRLVASEAPRTGLGKLGAAAVPAHDNQVIAAEPQSEVTLQVFADLVGPQLPDRRDNSNVQTALISARRIGAAIGILMVTRQVTEVQAFDLLQTESRRTKVKLRCVADRVFFNGVLGL